MNPFRTTRQTRHSGRPPRPRRRRVFYALAGLFSLLMVVSLTTGEDRILGSPADFERLARAPFGSAQLRGSLEREDLGEASGITASRLQDDLFWVVNDSGNDPLLYAIGADGRDRGALRVDGAKNRDWEDIASYRLADESGDIRSYLVIGDIGDNRSRRKKVTLYFVEEPALAAESFAEKSSVQLAWRQRFRFEDGPRDAEGLAVDAATKQILVVSKRNVPAEVYALPLRNAQEVAAEPDEVAVAERIAVLAIPQPTEEDVRQDRWQGGYRSQPTAFDIEKSERGAMILTYKHAYYYAREEGESWASALARDPALLALPALEQAEAGAFARDGKSFFATTEGRPAPLLRAPRK